MRPLFEAHQVSTILIVGGSGDYFDVADQVMMMDEYHLKDVTAEAKDIAQSDGYQRDLQANTQFGVIPSRALNASFSKKEKTIE